MKFRDFTLKPFRAGEIPYLKISGRASREGNKFSITYKLEGPLRELAIPALVPKPERRYCLWEETCLEFFIRPEESSSYREFNLSPAGHWNVFSFSSYREGMREEPAFSSLPFTVQSGPEFFSLSLEFMLAEIIEAEEKIHLAVSAVIKTIDEKLSYWALTHNGPKPDFHNEDGFVLEL